VKYRPAALCLQSIFIYVTGHPFIGLYFAKTSKKKTDLFCVIPVVLT
jgi:hypothetical protein